MDFNLFFRDILKCLNNTTGADMRECTEELGNKYPIRDFGIQNLYDLFVNNQGALDFFGVKMTSTKWNGDKVTRMFLNRNNSVLNFEDLSLGNKNIITVKGYTR